MKHKYEGVKGCSHGFCFVNIIHGILFMCYETLFIITIIIIGHNLAITAVMAKWLAGQTAV